MQPQIPASQSLLLTHSHNGLSLDVYGTVDQDGYEVTDVSLKGSTVSLFEVVDIKLLEQLTELCNDKLPAPLINRRREVNGAYGGNPPMYAKAA